MDNLALMPVENYGFWHNVRNKELFKVISIASPYCFLYESDLFSIGNSSISIPDLHIYDELVTVIGDDINKHPYDLARSLPMFNKLGSYSELCAIAQLRMLWHKQHYRGKVNQNQNRIEVQFKSSLSTNQELMLKSNLEQLATLVANRR